MNSKIKTVIIGASGYTGIELIRLLLNHKKVEITALVANSNAGQEISDIYSHLSNFPLPKLSKLEEVNFSNVDLAFCCLPHTTSQEVIKSLFEGNKYPNLKIIDLSADFRLKDIDNYKKWYAKDHIAPKIQHGAVYGLSELNRDRIKSSNLIACPGCYPTSILLPLVPLVKNSLIEESIIIDSKSGVSGAGRSLKLGNLYCEAANSVKAYSVCSHRHTGEVEQELSIVAGKEIQVNFTPHLIPMKRGIITTTYVTLKEGFKIDNIEHCLETAYEDEYFVNFVKNSDISTSDVYGTNFCKIAVFPARESNKAVLISVIDNLTKGSSGQAVQNMNIIFGFDDREGLEILPIFP